MCRTCGSRRGHDPGCPHYVPAARSAICRHCQAFRSIQARGLCSTCYRDPAIKCRYGKKKRGGDQYQHGADMSEEEVNDLVDQQMKNLPDWWNGPAAWVDDED